MSSWYRRHPKLTLLLVNAVLIFAFDWIAGSFVNIDLVGTFRRSHPIYHHDLRPSVRVKAQWGPLRYELITNSLGFRDGAMREVDLENDRRRILLMGDSFTEGVGVTWKESFAGRLAGAAGEDTEVLNAGVVGYAPTTYLLKTKVLLDQVGLDVDELVVFIDMSDIPNEILYAEWEPRDLADTGPPPPGLWERFVNRSLILHNIDRWRGRQRSTVGWNMHGMPFAEDLDVAALRDPEFDDGAHWTLSYKYARRGMENALARMVALADLCLDRGIRLAVVIYPWPANILAGEIDHPQVRLWRSFAAARGIRFLDLFPVFIRKGEDPRETVARFFVPGDVHWNPAGHALVAREVAPLLQIPLAP